MSRIFFLLLLCCRPVVPQTSLHLRGRVLDPSKKTVPQAAVTVFDSKDRAVYTATTSAAGEFIALLPSGSYRITIHLDGFADANVPLNLSGADKTMIFPLALERESVSMTVSDQAAKLDLLSDSHQDALKFDSSQLGSLPVRDGDVISAVSFFANPSGGQSPTIIVDGMERTDSVNLSPSQVQEVRLNNNAYSVEYPKPGKDRIEIDTKDGDDTLHGGFVFRTRNSVFDARNPLAASKLPFARSGYELNLSGPIVRKRVFFFMDADRENQQQTQPVLAYLPTGLLQQQTLAPFTRNLLVGRLDYQIAEGHRASAKYEFHQDEASNIGVGGFILPEAGSNRFHHDYRVELSDQWVFSPIALNNFRWALGTSYERIGSISDNVSIVVPGSFQNGGAQIDNWRREPRYEFQDIFSFAKGTFSLKAGAEARLHPLRNYSANNFGGTYQFSSLASYEAAQPVLYTLNAGNPLLISDQDDYAWFVQTEKQFGAATLFAGVRHEFQSHLKRHANFAPRIAAAIALDHSRQSVLRLGAGMFYDRRPPTILLQSERFNGFNTLQYLIQSPTFPINPAALEISPLQTTVYPIDAALTLPRIYQASITLERRLPAGFMATADFTSQRGTHLFRTRNINAPLPETLARPDPTRGNIDQIESSASSRGQALNITLKTPPKKHYQLFAQYTLAYQRDDTSNVFGPPPPGGTLPPGVTAGNLFSLPADNYNLRPEWGPGNSDIRHRLGIGATLPLPWHFNFGTLASVHSGLPYDITTGFDNNGDTDPNDRPAGVTRNAGRGAGYFSIDVHLARPVSFQLREHKIDCEFAVDSFNLLNRNNPSSYVGVETSPGFRQPNAAYEGREMQFSVQVRF